MDTNYIGDKTQSYDKGQEEADSHIYICECGFSKEVFEEYDLLSGFFFPIRFADTQCDQCGEYMDRGEYD